MKPVPFPDVDRCRQLLGEEAETMTDAEVLHLRDELAMIADVIIPAIARGAQMKEATS